jgi:hypothetical protein
MVGGTAAPDRLRSAQSVETVCAAIAELLGAFTKNECAKPVLEDQGNRLGT